MKSTIHGDESENQRNQDRKSEQKTPGNPAKIKRNLTWEEKLGIMENSKEYLTVSEEMKNQEIL